MRNYYMPMYYDIEMCDYRKLTNKRVLKLFDIEKATWGEEFLKEYRKWLRKENKKNA